MPVDDFPAQNGPDAWSQLTLSEQLAQCGFAKPPPALPENSDPLHDPALMVSTLDRLTRQQHAIRMRVAHEMAEYLIAEDPPVVAANLCGFDLAEVEAAMAIDPIMARKLRRASAMAAHNLVQRVRSGAKGISKMALEILSRQHNGWAPRTQSNLESQFADALRELKARLDGDAMAIVLEVFGKYSR